MEARGGVEVRKIVWAVVVAMLLSSAPVPLAAASQTYASCGHHKKAKNKKMKVNRPGKYKAPKFRKGKKHHKK